MKHRWFFLLFFCFFYSLSLWAEYSPRIWLNSSAGAAYHSVDPELEQLFSKAEAKDIPGDIIVDKIKEGAAKVASGLQMVQALNAEVERLTTAVNLLSKEGRNLSGERSLALRAISLLLQGGMHVDTIDAVLEYASLLQKPSSRAIAALSASFRVIAIAQAPADLLRPLSESLVRSTLQDPQFVQLSSLAVRAKSKQLKGEQLIKMMIGSLDSGGGLTALDRDLQRRSQRP